VKLSMVGGGAWAGRLNPGSTRQAISSTLVVMAGVKQLLKHGPLWGLIKPGYPDGARLVAQGWALRSMLAIRPFEGSCLNAGCGEGLYCPLVESFPAVTSIENVDISIAPDFRLRHPDQRNCVAQGSLTELPYGDRQFDCCLCTEVIEHIQDHAKAVSELARVLKPNGFLLTSVPQTPAPWDPNHARQGYSLDEFTRLLRGAGLEVIAHRSCLFVLMRSVMLYWRRPLVRFGRDRTPYVPEPLLRCLAVLDRWMPLGRPWDLVVLAVRR
jgi:SAM-dependent methyltransferase